MKYLIILTASFFFFSNITNAQESSGYKTAIGVRLGPSVPAVKSGLTIKHFIGQNALEGILSFGDGITVCALFEKHRDLPMPDLKWFIGFGGYAGFTNQTTSIGAAGIVGLDYKFPAIPLNISLDWKPELNILTKVGFQSSTVGFSARFTF